MKTKGDFETLERLVGQLQGLHTEISLLAKKSPNDAVNTFKLKLINKVIVAGNAVLGKKYRPFTDFEVFNIDDLPTNSDVTMILSQYLERTERFRSDNVGYSGGWKYIIDGEVSQIPAAAPTRIGSKE